MKPNPLYHYINREIMSRPDSALGSQVFVSRLDRNHHYYLLTELSLTRAVTILSGQQKYSLLTHYLHFYNLQDNNNYHYIAYFQDKRKKLYLLRADFDHTDQLTSPVTFSQVDGDDNALPVTLEKEVLASLTDCAIDQSSAVIAELRFHQQLDVAALVSRYHSVEQRLMIIHKDLALNKQEHQSLLYDAMRILDSLSVYADDREDYAAILKLYKLISERVDNILIGARPEPDQQPVNMSIAKAAYALADIISTEKPLDNQDKIQQLKELQHLIDDIFKATDDDDYFFSIQDYQRTVTLLTAYKRIAKQLLIALLESKQYDAAEPLLSFTTLPLTDIVKLAIKTCNAELLRFLLNYCQFPINTYYIENNLTPVLYCYARSSTDADSNAIHSCLLALLQHHASAMVTLEDGLPVGYHITKHRFHPLKLAIITFCCNSKNTIQFYERVVLSINNYLAAGNLTNRTVNTLKHDRDYLLEVIQSLARAENTDSSQQKTVSPQQPRSQLSFLTRLGGDSEYINLRNRFFKLISQYASRLPTAKKAAAMECGTDFVTKIIAINNAHTCYESFRTAALTLLKECHLTIDNQLALLIVQERIMTENLSRKELSECKQIEQALLNELSAEKASTNSGSGIFNLFSTQIKTKSASATPDLQPQQNALSGKHIP